MVVLVPCKNEEDPIENVGARGFTIHPFFNRARADIYGVGCGIWPKF